MGFEAAVAIYLGGVLLTCCVLAFLAGRSGDVHSAWWCLLPAAALWPPLLALGALAIPIAAAWGLGRLVGSAE